MPGMNLSSLKKAMKVINDRGDLRPLGTCDAIVGIKAGGKYYRVNFEAFEVRDVADTDADELQDADFCLTMKKKDFDAYLAAIADGQAQSLNELDLAQSVVTGSPRGRLKFLQYHRTLDAFMTAVASPTPSTNA